MEAITTIKTKGYTRNNIDLMLYRELLENAQENCNSGSLKNEYLQDELEIIYELIDTENSLIIAARKEGTEQEKAILLSSELTSWCGHSDEYGDMLMMPFSVLSPSKPEMKP